MAWKRILDDGDISATTPIATGDGVGDAGVATTVSRSDHQHAFAPRATLDMLGQRLTGLGAPSAGSDAVRLVDMHSLSAGIDWKASVRVATTTAGALASSFQNGDVIDGVALATGNRILIKDQAAGAENGLYIVQASGAPVRSIDADISAEVTSGLAVFVEQGTANADTGWVLTTDGTITLGSTALVFTQFSGLGQVVAGSGLSKTGATLDVNVDNSSIEVSGDTLQIKALGVTNAMLAGSIALAKLATDPLARANHTGTQIASTISDFDTQVRTSRLDQMAVPTASLDFSNASATINGLKPVSYITADRPTEQTGRIIYDSQVARLMVSR